MRMLKLLSVRNPVQCSILERVNRFTVRVKVGGECFLSHLANSGRLHELVKENAKGYCVPGGKKTSYRLFAVEEGGFAALIDTVFQAKVFENAVRAKAIPWLKGYEILKKNVVVYDSVLDYLLLNPQNGDRMFLEVKSAVLRGDRDFAMYPDCPTERGRRHIMNLIKLAGEGEKATVLFIAALPNVSAFKPFKEGDPKLSDLLVDASKRNVAVKAVAAYYNPLDHWVHLYNPDLPVIL